MTEFAELIEPVALRLYGEPGERGAHEWRFGSRGSLKVNVAGPHKGTFLNFETGSKGGVLDMISEARGGDRKASLDWLRSEFGDVAGKPEAQSGKRIAAIYAYHDQRGATVFEVVRFEPKDFRQRRPDGLGGFEWNVKGVAPLIYRLPEVEEAKALGRAILVVEGEKDADRLASIGIAATCNAGGAGKWTEHHAAFLKGADVVIVPDNDDPGRAHGETVAASLDGMAASVRWLELPDLPRKGDVSDWLERGGSRESLDALLERAPSWPLPRPRALPAIRMGEEDQVRPRTWLVKALLAAGELSVIYAPSGGGKSFFALDLGARTAAGMNFFGLPSTAGPVLYVAGEGATGFRLRMKAWRQRHAPKASPPFFMIPRSLDLRTGREAVDVLASDVAAYGREFGEPVRLIVLDTLSRMLGGGVDAEPRDVAAFLYHVEALREATGAHICIVHHLGKDKDRGPRGASQIRDMADTVIEISRPGDGDLFKAVVEKQKDGEEGRIFTYTLAKSTVGVDEDGDEITSCTVEPAGANAGHEDHAPRLSKGEEIARRTLVDLLVEGIRPPSSAAIPPSVTVAVKLDDWRREVYRRPITSSEDSNAKRQAFHRIRQKLNLLNIIGEADEWVWLT